MALKEFNVAFEKANEVLREIPQAYCEEFIPLEKIILAVKKLSGFSEINIFQESFKTIDSLEKVKNNLGNGIGAMLSTSTDKVTKEKVADLIINLDYDSKMQRFSVAHELGHLITNVPNFTYEEIDDGQFTVSAHVNPDITYISEEQCKSNNYLIAEQIANIFALLVLIPNDIRIRDLKNIGIEELTKKYGVNEDAIYSRILLSSVTRSYVI